jgi:hypothetical protein
VWIVIFFQLPFSAMRETPVFPSSQSRSFAAAHEYPNGNVAGHASPVTRPSAHAAGPVASVKSEADTCLLGGTGINRMTANLNANLPVASLCLLCLGLTSLAIANPSPLLHS